jgi:hypothetical protein
MLERLSRFIRACVPASLKQALAAEVQRLAYTDNKMLERTDLMLQVSEQEHTRMCRELEARIECLEQRLAAIEGAGQAENTSTGE